MELYSIPPLFLTWIWIVSRGSSVSIVTDLRTGCPELNFRYEQGYFIFATAFRPALGPTQPPIQWVPGALSSGVKRQVCEADCSPSFSAEVKNAWSYTSTLLYVFVVWHSINHRWHGTYYLSTRINVPIFMSFALLREEAVCSCMKMHSWNETNVTGILHRTTHLSRGPTSNKEL
jgi:hypothetical protein